MFGATLVLASLGQTCNIQGTYRQQATTRAYTATLYQQAYNSYAPAYSNYAAYTTQYIPVVYQDYTALVGNQQRNYDRRLEALKAQADLAGRLDKLAASLEGLNALVARDVQQGPSVPLQQVPDVPGKPLPPVPAKPTPQAPDGPAQPQPPPLPKTNPDDGSVPPPPVPAPGPAGGGSVSAETSAIFVAKCQRCHSALAAPKSGGGYALFGPDGSVRSDFTGPELLKIMFQVETGAMPAKDPVGLSAEELGHVRASVMASKAVAAFLSASN